MSDENHGEKISNITIDPNGDVSALMVCPVYGTSISARVSSKCLSLASSVFSAMLGPQSMFLEGTQLRSAAQLELNLDDNGEAMLNILKLLHHKNKNVPRELDIEMLYETAIIVDKYDLLEAIRPWIIIWFDPYREKISDSVSSPEVWVDISWVFEDTCMFKEISRHLILETCIDSNEDLITREGHKVGEIVPDGIHDALKKERSKILDVLTRVLANVVAQERAFTSGRTEIFLLGLDDEALEMISARHAHFRHSQSSLQAKPDGEPSERGPYLTDILKAFKSGEHFLEGRTFSPAPLRFRIDGTLLDTDIGAGNDSIPDYDYSGKLVNLAYAAEGAIVGLDLYDFKAKL